MKGNSKKNIITGFLYQVINAGVGFLLPYLLITHLGSESNGLISSVGQLFVCLGLLEAGVGISTLQALYKPISEGDRDAVSRILSATDRSYKKTGYIYSAGVILICLVYPYLVDSELSAAEIRWVVLLYGAGSAVGYFVQSKYKYLLQAEGKNYIINLIMIAESFMRNGGKFLAIYLGYDVVAVQAVHFTVILFEAAALTIIVKIKYRWLNTHSEPDYQAISQKNAVLIQSVAWMVFNHTDVLVLTLFARDLTLVSVYAIYLLVFEAIQNISDTARTSFQYKLGNYYTKDRHSFIGYSWKYTTVVSTFTSALFVTAFLLSSSFVAIYTSRAKDTDYMLRFLPELFLLFKMMYCERCMLFQMIEVSGHFRSSQKIAIVESVINLAVSVIAVPFLNIHGVLIGTVVSLVYSVSAYIRFVGRNILEKNGRFLMRQLILNMIPVVIAVAVNQAHPITADGYIMWAVKAVPTTLIVFAVYAGVLQIQRRLIGEEWKKYEL